MITWVSNWVALLIDCRLIDCLIVCRDTEAVRRHPSPSGLHPPCSVPYPPSGEHLRRRAVPLHRSDPHAVQQVFLRTGLRPEPVPVTTRRWFSARLLQWCCPFSTAPVTMRCLAVSARMLCFPTWQCRWWFADSLLCTISDYVLVPCSALSVIMCWFLALHSQQRYAGCLLGSVSNDVLVPCSALREGQTGAERSVWWYIIYTFPYHDWRISGCPSLACRCH